MKESQGAVIAVPVLWQFKQILESLTQESCSRRGLFGSCRANKCVYEEIFTPESKNIKHVGLVLQYGTKKTKAVSQHYQIRSFLHLPKNFSES